MFAQFSVLPEQASTYAGQVDALFLFLIVISGFFSLLIAVLIIYFAIKYRRRPGGRPHRPRSKAPWRSNLPGPLCLSASPW